MSKPLRNVLLVSGLRVHICPKVASTSIQNALAPLGYQHRPPDEIGSELRLMAVRHPLDRIVSAWKYFCHNPEAEKRIAGTLGHLGYNALMPFEEFTELCLVNHHMNRHTRKQVDFKGPFRIHYLVPMDRLTEAWEEIRGRLPHLPELSHVNKTSHGDWSEYYTDAAKQRVEAVFQDDLTLYEQAITWQS